MKIAYFLLLLVSLPSAAFNIHKYDPGLAASVSLDYLDLLFIQKEVVKSYEVIDPIFKKEVARADYIQLFKPIVEGFNANKFVAKKYEYIGGEIGEIHVFIYAEGAAGKVFFRIKLLGSADGYRVFHLKTVASLPLHPEFKGKLGEYPKDLMIEKAG